MTQEAVMDIFREAIFVAMKISGPFLAASIVIGLVISIFQAATQIHEQTIVFVPKLVATGFILIILGSWFIRIMTNFTDNIFQFINALL